MAGRCSTSPCDPLSHSSLRLCVHPCPTACDYPFRYMQCPSACDIPVGLLAVVAATRVLYVEVRPSSRTSFASESDLPGEPNAWNLILAFSIHCKIGEFLQDLCCWNRVPRRHQERASSRCSWHQRWARARPVFTRLVGMLSRMP